MIINDNEKIERRNFLKKIGMIVGSGLLLSATPWLAGCSEDEKKELNGRKLKLAIIGTGSRGMYHIGHLKLMNDVEVVALCDIYQPHLNQAANEFPNAKCFADYRKILDMNMIDAVLIATPLFEHARMTIDSLKAGKHVFCEKSMSNNLSDCLDMYNTYKRGNRVLYIGHQRLFDKKYVKAMQMIHDGIIGPVTGIRAYWFRNNDWRRPVPSPDLDRQINWRLYKDLSCGIMTELAAHQIQIGNWALHSIPDKVSGYGDIVFWKDGRNVYDSVSLVYHYKNGVKMTYESNISNKFDGLEEEVLGNKGTMKLETGKYFFEEASPAPGIMQLINQAEHNIFDNVAIAGPSWVPETASINKGEDIIANSSITSGESTVGALNDGSFELLQSFIQSSLLNRKAHNLVEEAYYSSTLALLGLQAMEEERTIYFPDEYRIPYLNNL